METKGNKQNAARNMFQTCQYEIKKIKKRYQNEVINFYVSIDDSNL